MSISEIMNKSLIKLELQAGNKDDVINELASILDENGKLLDKQKYVNAVIEREKVFSTAIGMGIAIPHGKSDGVKEPALAFGRSKTGIDYKAADGSLAHLFFMVAVPEGSNDEHLRLLGQISRKLMHAETREKLLQAETSEDIIKALE
jgi:fructose-specific phosphotransferase system IIA component